MNSVKLFKYVIVFLEEIISNMYVFYKDGSRTEPDLGAKLPGEHQVAEGDQ